MSLAKTIKAISTASGRKDSETSLNLNQKTTQILKNLQLSTGQTGCRQTEIDWLSVESVDHLSIVGCQLSTDWDVRCRQALLAIDRLILSFCWLCGRPHWLLSTTICCCRHVEPVHVCAHLWLMNLLESSPPYCLVFSNWCEVSIIPTRVCVTVSMDSVYVISTF